ncbi:hypothetical protein ACTFIY_006858 [Dictyostelium cf. discoideum]
MKLILVILLSNTNLTAYERNNGFHSITLEYPITSTINLTDKRKKLTDYGIPIDKIYIGKGRKKKIHLLIKHRDYHIITGRVKIAKDKVEVINALLKNSYKDENPYALYNIDYSGDSYHIFALIEYKLDDAKNSEVESDNNNKDKQTDYNFTDTISKSDNNKQNSISNNDTNKPESINKNKNKLKIKNTITSPNTGDQSNSNLISGPKEVQIKSDSKDLVVDIKEKITKRTNSIHRTP